MPVFHKHKIIFSHNPKAGGTSVIKSFDLNNTNDFNQINVFGYLNHPGRKLIAPNLILDNHVSIGIENLRTASEIKEIVTKRVTGKLATQHLNRNEICFLFKDIHGIDISAYSSFAIIREPVSRFASALWMKGVTKKSDVDDIVRNLIRKKDLLSLTYFHPNFETIGFKSPYTHLREQYLYTLDVTKIFSMDNYTTLLPRYTESLGFKIKIGHANRASSLKNQNYSNFVTMIRKNYESFVKVYYEEDFKIYERVLLEEKSSLIPESSR